MKIKRSSTAKKRPARGNKAKPTGKNGTTSDLRRRCKDLERERNSLRRELQEVKTERDQIRRSLFAAMDRLHPPLPPPTWEEVQESLRRPSLREFIDELEAEMKSWERADGKCPAALSHLGLAAR